MLAAYGLFPITLAPMFPGDPSSGEEVAFQPTRPGSPVLPVAMHNVGIAVRLVV